MSELIGPAALATALETLPLWSGSTTSLERTITAPDFLTAVRVVDDVAVAAEEANHHPDIDIRWRRVRFALSTHDAGGVTEKDLDLARTIDSIAAAHTAT
jgi:4a-hydroxytetrahydrobiopterin dehydratase